MSWHQPENPLSVPATEEGHPGAFTQFAGGPTFFIDHQGALRRMKEELETSGEEPEITLAEHEPMDLDTTPPGTTTYTINTSEPTEGAIPETLFPKYGQNCDWDTFRDAVQESLPRSQAGLTAQVLHVTYKYRLAKDQKTWHCERCHFTKNLDDKLYNSVTIHNVQPAWVPSDLWNPRCPFPDCHRLVSHTKDVVDCGRCCETLVLNPRMIHDLHLTLRTEPKLLYQQVQPSENTPSHAWTLVKNHS